MQNREQPSSSAEQEIAAGWYSSPGGQRFWDGRKWTEHRAPLPQDLESAVKTILWAFSLAFGVAGALAWNAPVLVYYWPLGLGGASLALAVVASTLKGDRPWIAAPAIMAGVVAVFLGFAGYQELEETRSGFDRLFGE